MTASLQRVSDLRLSVLIATYNRRALLAMCLEHLLVLTDQMPDEVVVVVGGRDGSAELVREYQTRFPILKLMEVENRSLGDSQNRGLPHCGGDLVATLDDDAFVEPDWSWQVKVAHAAHPEAGCIGGRIFNYFPDNVVARFESFVGMPYDLATGFYTRTVAGVSCTYKRSVMAQVGDFDATLPAGMDSDYNWRIQQAGFKVWFEPNIRLRHMNRTSLLKFLRQQFWYGRGYYLTRRKHPDLYSAYPRDLSRWQDWIKLLLMPIGPVLESFRKAWRAPSLTDKLLFFPLIFLKEIWWRAGWISQMRAGAEGQ